MEVGSDVGGGNGCILDSRYLYMEVSAKLPFSSLPALSDIILLTAIVGNGLSRHFHILHSACSASVVVCLLSLTSFAISLNSDIPASPIHSYIQLSDVVTTAPSFLSRANAIGTSSLLQLLTPSASTYTLCPSRSRSSVVCVTQMCDSMPTMTASNLRCEDPAAWVTAVRTSGVHMEKVDLSAWTCDVTPPGWSIGSCLSVSPSRARFCVVTKTGMLRICAGMVSRYTGSVGTMHTGSKHLLCGRNHLRILMDGGPKFLLDVADAALRRVFVSNGPSRCYISRFQHIEREHVRTTGLDLL
jgi:hypothetical protein